MKTFTANSAKQQLGHVLDTARTTPVSITRHGRAAFVVTSKEDYDALVNLKFEKLKQEVQKGFTQLDEGNISTRSLAEIASQAVSDHEKSQTLS